MTSKSGRTIMVRLVELSGKRLWVLHSLEKLAQVTRCCKIKIQIVEICPFITLVINIILAPVRCIDYTIIVKRRPKIRIIRIKIFHIFDFECLWDIIKLINLCTECSIGFSAGIVGYKFAEFLVGFSCEVILLCVTPARNKTNSSVRLKGLQQPSRTMLLHSTGRW